jgi:hypothetical protein
MMTSRVQLRFSSAFHSEFEIEIESPAQADSVACTKNSFLLLTGAVARSFQFETGRFRSLCVVSRGSSFIP